MFSEADKYTYRVTWSEEDGEFVGLCAELSKLSWLAHGPEEAMKGIRLVVKDCIEDMTKNGEEIPKPMLPDNTAGSSWSESHLKYIAGSLHKLLNLVLA